MSDRQTQFDFSRGEQLALLREAVLPDCHVSEGARSIAVKADGSKAVLRVIDDYAGKSGVCWASAATIARAANMSLRKCSRCLAVLEHQLGLITRDENDGGGAVIHRRIVWSELALLCSRGRPATYATSGTGSPREPMPQSHQPMPQSHQPVPQSHQPVPPVAQEPPESQEPPLTAEWQEVAAAFERVGLTSPAVLRTAQQRGLSAGQCIELAETYLANRGRLDTPGAIAYRIQTGHWPADGVRELADIRAASARREQERQERQRREAMTRDAAAARLAELESRYGQVLDALPPDQLDQLAARAFEGNAFLLARWRRDRGCPHYREQLLAALADNGLAVVNGGRHQRVLSAVVGKRLT